MQQSTQPRPLRSLRIQFYVAIAALLIILMSLSLYASFRMQTALSDIRDATDEFADDMDAIAALQDAVFRYAAGSTTVSPDNAGRLADVERLLEATMERFAADEHAESRQLLQQAAAEWRLARQLAERGAAAVTGSGQPDATASASVHLASVGVALDDVRKIEAGSVSGDLTAAERNVSLPMIGLRAMLVFAVAAAAIGTLAVHRIVVRPLAILRDGAQRFANGDLDYRLAVEHVEEFGEVSRVFNAMADRLSSQMQTLSAQAVRDPLTGLYNRRELEKRLNEEFARTRRFRRSFAVLMVDIDHFKAVNDACGHLAGDDVLIEVARRLRAQIRIIDLVARFGGEEFVVVLSEIDARAATVVAERIRNDIRQPIVSANTTAPVTVTVSIGLALAPALGADVQSLLGAADKALYQAKERGRDNTTAFVPPPTGTGVQDAEG